MQGEGAENSRNRNFVTDVKDSTNGNETFCETVTTVIYTYEIESLFVCPLNKQKRCRTKLSVVTWMWMFVGRSWWG